MPSALSSLELQHPILLAPLGGGPSTPELVAAVSAAGGAGFLGAAYRTPQQTREAIRRVRALTSRPFGVNLFTGGWTQEKPQDTSAALAMLRPFFTDSGSSISGQSFHSRSSE